MMGLPMARSLLRHGRALLACDPNPAARDALSEGAEAGAVRFAAAPAEVAEAAETVILVLPDSKAVAQVVEGPGGLLPALRPGHLVIDRAPRSPPKRAASPAPRPAGAPPSSTPRSRAAWPRRAKGRSPLCWAARTVLAPVPSRSCARWARRRYAPARSAAPTR